MSIIAGVKNKGTDGTHSLDDQKMHTPKQKLERPKEFVPSGVKFLS